MPGRERSCVRVLAAGLLLAFVALVLLGQVPTAYAESVADQASIKNYEGTVRVNADGTLGVHEAVTYDFGGTPTDSVQRVITTREQYDATDDRLYDVSDLTADADQVRVDTSVDSGDTSDTMTVSFAQAQSGEVTVTYDYQVDGTVAETPDGLEVRWPVVQGFDLPIANATVRWNAPNALWMSCLAGSPGSSRPCTTSQLVDVAAPTMTQVDLKAGGELVGILGLDASANVEPSTDLKARWSLSRAFTASGPQLAVALAVVLLGVLAALLLWWTRGRDSGHEGKIRVRPLLDRGDGSLVFAPPSAVRPGQMGTLVDEHADVVDVASTVLDLAVRNYLFIEEQPRAQFGRGDWLLRKRNDAGDELLPYEREVIEAIFAGSDNVLVSELEAVLRPRLSDVQALLYDDMVRQGWFGERPDAVRSRWTTAGWVLVAAGVVLTGILAAVTTYGLVGLGVILAGVALAGSGQVAPARTSRGSKVLRELQDYRAYLEAGDIDDIPLAQREELVSRFYPYAVVFGIGDRWAAALAAMDVDDTPDEPLYWYGAPEDWHLSNAGTSLPSMAQALSNAIGSRRLLATSGD
jgi:uncharacterized protein (TIGR04222 family)